VGAGISLEAAIRLRASRFAACIGKLLAHWPLLSDSGSVARPRSEFSHQTVTISLTAPFFDALVLYLLENIGPE
jgi:hypothetical protein